MNKPKRSIMIESRVWFNKAKGHSYYSNRYWVDGKVVGQHNIRYGDRWIAWYEGIKEFAVNGYVPEEWVDRAQYEVNYESKFDVYHVVSDVQLKADLFASGWSMPQVDA